MDPRVYWVAFNQVFGIGAVRMQTLLTHFESLEVAWTAPYEALRGAGLTPQLAERVLSTRKSTSLEEIWEKIEQSGVQVFTLEDAAYPRLLQQIQQPPPVLYVRGEVTAQDELAVAIVGTRRMTAYGRQVTEELSTYLASNGLTVVSGLARGVDRVAHEAALKAGGRTLAVLGSGVDTIYPPEHETLAKRIIDSGAVISDYALGTAPESRNFPPRNRIISGLSLAVVVIEAGETSGALITTSFAARQGRDVFAVPGNIFSPQSKGVNKLIYEGATPLLNYGQILEELHIGQTQQQVEARSLLPADDIEARLLQQLSSEGQHIDEICVKSGLPIEQVSATLTIMELKGMVRNTGGMSYAALREESAEYRTDHEF